MRSFDSLQNWQKLWLQVWEFPAWKKNPTPSQWYVGTSSYTVFSSEFWLVGGSALLILWLVGPSNSLKEMRKIRYSYNFITERWGNQHVRVVKTRDCYLHCDFDASQADGICIIAEKRENKNSCKLWGSLGAATSSCIFNNVCSAQLLGQQCVAHQMQAHDVACPQWQTRQRKASRVWLDTIHSLINSVFCVRMSKWKRKICI